MIVFLFLAVWHGGTFGMGLLLDFDCWFNMDE